ncbi:uncharacterized protein [Palaemon carinicauda]|uniref:uncharacterized protein n=1 Tax=Palaemon carinicauda TaxID=392227 RepID=UPI0035B61F94
MDQTVFELELRQTLEGKAEYAVIQLTIQRDQRIQDLLRTNSFKAQSTFNFNLKKCYEVLHAGDANRLIRRRKDSNEHKVQFASSLKEVLALPSKESHGQTSHKKYAASASHSVSTAIKRKPEKFQRLCPTTDGSLSMPSSPSSQLKLVTGRPRHPQSKGAVELLNGVIQDKWTIWMRENNNNRRWSVGLKFGE